MAAGYLPKILLALTIMSGWGVFSVNAAEPLQTNERKQPADYVNPFVKCATTPITVITARTSRI